MTISVTQLGNFLKAMLDSEVLLYDLKVEGEISNCRQSGEVVFFVLKDQNAQIDCFCYNPPKQKLSEGQQVVVSGKPNYYIKGGKFSFVVSKIESKDTQGDKFKQLMLLKEKLQNLGLFDAQRKKPINTNCKKIGVVTSCEGAVIQDIRNVCTRRNPMVDILVYDSRVQGVNSENSIIKGLKYLDNTDVDNIVIARGGGSNEDLSAFNGENLVYSIANCTKPVISAVGHETDWTLCDFVADVRASTPSVAAELCTQNIQGVIDELCLRLQNQFVFINSKIKNSQTQLNNAKQLLTSRVSNLLLQRQTTLEKYQQSLLHEMRYILSSNQNSLEKLLLKLDQNSPAKILQKGFSLIQVDGKISNSVKNIKKDMQIEVVFKDGIAKANVVDIEVKNEF